MGTNHRQDLTDVGSPSFDRRRIGLLAMALLVSWASMLFHNLSELPITLTDLANMGPLAFDVVLLVACWWRPRSRVLWAVILAWGLLNMVVGGIVTVLPLPILPFVPEQTVEHYAVHLVYTIGQLPLVLVATMVLYREQGTRANGGRDGRADD